MYEIESNSNIKQIGYKEFNPASYRGDIAIALSVLHNNGIVSDKEFEEDNGYYTPDNGYVRITVL